MPILLIFSGLLTFAVDSATYILKVSGLKLLFLVQMSMEMPNL